MGSSILIMTILIIKLSVFRHILLSSALVLIPFFFAGIFLCTVFRLYPKIAGSLYAANLIGAASGAVLTIVLLETVGVRLNLIISGLAAIPAVLLMARAAPDKFNNRILAFVVAELIAVIILGSYQAILEPIPFANGTFKEMALLLS
jgi:hypothetical protein